MEKRKPKGPSPDELLDVIDLRDFTQRAVTRTFPKNTVVVSEGDRTDSLYIIVSGKVKIYVSDEKGKEVVLNESGPGEYFGEMVLDEGPRSASVMTLEPTQFLVVPKEDFREFVKKNPEFSLHLIYKLIKRVRALTNDVKSLALVDVYGRRARWSAGFSATLPSAATSRSGATASPSRKPCPEPGSPGRARRRAVSPRAACSRG